MQRTRWMIGIIVICFGAIAASAQGKLKIEPNPVQLELRSSIVSTTDDGYPSVMQMTLQNTGNVVVTLPMPQPGCVVRGGEISVQYTWHSLNPDDLRGKGHGEYCGGSDIPPILERAKKEWIQLHPGEQITVSENLLSYFGQFEEGEYEYWAEYIPPEASAAELKMLREAGYNIPTEKLEAEHRTFIFHQ